VDETEGDGEAVGLGDPDSCGPAVSSIWSSSVPARALGEEVDELSSFTSTASASDDASGVGASVVSGDASTVGDAVIEDVGEGKYDDGDDDGDEDVDDDGDGDG
jgi:hypothetical protein